MKIAIILCMMVILITLYNNSQEGLILLGMIVTLTVLIILYDNSGEHYLQSYECDMHVIYMLYLV